MRKLMAQSGPDLSARLGLRVQLLRASKGLSQSELADTVGVKQSAISMLENGQRVTRVSLNTLDKIAKALDVDRLSDLIRQLEDLPPLEESLRKAQRLLGQTPKKRGRPTKHSLTSVPAASR